MSESNRKAPAKTKMAPKPAKRTTLNMEEPYEEEVAKSAKEVQKKKSQALGPSKTPVKRPFHNIDKDPQDKSHLHKSPQKRKKTDDHSPTKRVKSKSEDITFHLTTNTQLVLKMQEIIEESNNHFLTCRACRQCSFAPFSTETLPFMLKHFYQYVVCTKCLKACHYGCLPYECLPPGDYSYVNLQSEQLKSTEQVILYECQPCQSEDTASECIACLKSTHTHPVCDANDTKVHQMCAILLEKQFQYLRPGTYQFSQESMSGCCTGCESKQGLMIKCDMCPAQAHAVCSEDWVTTLKHNERTLRVNLCPKHAGKVVNCYGCDKDPEEASEQDPVVWVSCDYCNVWYHDICIKKQMLTVDRQKTFKCEFCTEVEFLMTGDAGLVLTGKFTNPLLQINKQQFNSKSLLKTVSKPGQPQQLFCVLLRNLWLLLSAQLQQELTTETLLTLFTSQTKYFLGSPVLIKQSVPTNLKVTQVADISKDGQVNDEALITMEQCQLECQEFIQTLQPNSHLKDLSEQVYVAFQQRQTLLQAASLLKHQRNRADQVTTVILQCEQLQLTETNTYQYLLLKYNEYLRWESSITRHFYQPKKTQQQLEHDLTQIKSMFDPSALLAKRLEELNQIFSSIPDCMVVIDALQEANKQNLVDDNYFRQQVLEKIQVQKGIIDDPNVSESKPCNQLLQILCYLASEPFQVGVEPLLLKYKQSCEWEIKVKDFVGKKEAWIEHAIDYGNNWCDQLGEIPNVYFDVQLWQTACIKSGYIKELKDACKFMTELQDEIPIQELEKYVGQCKSLGHWLDSEVHKVQSKISLMQKVLSLTMASGGDQNYEELLQSVMTEVYQAKMRQVYIPLGLETMLEGKVQIIEELRCEFNQTLVRCADSFNKQCATELRKTLQKAKDHKLVMEKEKKILECLPKSEDWFMQTFAKLKQMCGPQLHQIDFKDYAQLHSVIKSQKDCELLLKLPPNIKPETLVAAARNLYQSLQGAKWVFEVRSLMQGAEPAHRELSHLLNLYYKAKELQINLQLPDEYILTDDDDILREFEQLAQKAVQFDSLFGTHQKIIATLEKYESKGEMVQLVATVDKIQEKLIHIKESRCQISPALELDVLQKVRSYISLNEDYQTFIQSQSKPIECQEVDAALFNKLSYAKALRLQRQARESQIPEDIPVLRRLNSSVLKFEKFRRECADYFKFRERIKTKEKPDSSDSSFNLKFVKRLIEDSESIEIQISSETFDAKQIKEDLALYEIWKSQAEYTLKKLESELQRKSELSLQGDIFDQFQKLKEQISQCPVYNTELFQKIQAFEWVYQMSRLLNDQQRADKAQILNLQYWKTNFEQHTQHQQALPLLKDHPILQRILWEIDQATTLTDFVKVCKNTQRSLSGKFVQMQKGSGADNYMLFKNKHSKEKLNRIIEQASRCKVDITSEIHDLNQWASQHERYFQMHDDGTLWTQGYDKVQTIQRNIFQSPIDFSNLYFEIEKRLEIAEDIRSDLKLVLDAAAKTEKRIRYSRVASALNHFHKNCQITQIPEVERISKMIAVSQDVLAKCESLLETPDCDLGQVRQMIQSQIVVDLETDEVPVRREVFERTVQCKAKILHSQFRLLEKDYLRLKHVMSKVGLEYSQSEFDSLRVKVRSCVQRIKAQDYDVQLDEVNFEQTIADKQAQLYVKSKAQQLARIGQTELADDVEMKDSSDDSMLSCTSSSDDDSELVSKNSVDSSSSDGAEHGEDEMSEESEDGGIAQNRARREVKPNLMDDHIYFFKKPSVTNEPTESRKAILAKRIAKQAAKEFEKQKLKAQKQIPQTEQQLDFSKFQIQDDDEISKSINQMKLRIRNQSKATIQNALQNADKQFAHDLEEQVSLKFPQIDQQYRSKIQDVVRNLETLKQCESIWEQYFVKKTAPISKLLQSQINFTDMFNKAWQAKKLELRRQQRPAPRPEQPLRAMYPSRPVQMMHRPQIKPVEPIRRNSADSIESLQSNPAQFSDDDDKMGGYDPMSTKPQTASFLYPPPGVNLPQFSYNPTLSLIQLSQNNQQKEQILYDPIAHSGNQPIQPQHLRVTLARPGSLLKVYDGCLDVQMKDCNFKVTCWSFQDVRLFQKLPLPAPILTLKGKSTIKEVCDHFLKIQHDPNAGQLLRGYCQRTSYLNAEQSERYQRFYDSMEQAGRVAVFNLLEGVSIYLIPITRATREFVKQIGIQTDSTHLNVSASLKGDLEPETHMFAWVSQVRQLLPLRSNQIWNPQVVKSFTAPEPPPVPVKDVPAVKFTSPITSEEPSHESAKQKKKVEINLIQPATKVKAEQTETKMEDDDIDIDALIARFRNNGETNIEATLPPIIHKLSVQGRKSEKLEAFLKEVIAKNQKSIKQEQPVSYPSQPSQPLIYQYPPHMGYPTQQQFQGGSPYMMSFPGIRPPVPMVGQQHPTGQHPYQQQMYSQFPQQRQQLPPPHGMPPHQQYGQPQGHQQQYPPQGPPPQFAGQPHMYRPNVRFPPPQPGQPGYYPPSDYQRRQ